MRKLMLVFSLLCIPCWGVVSIGQSVPNTNNANLTLSKAFAFDNVAHHLIVVSGYSRRITGGPPTLTVADTAGNTYTQASTFVDSGPFVRGYVWYVCDSLSGPNTVTVTGSGGTTGLELGIIISEVVGVVNTPCLDVGIGGAAGFSQTVLSASATTTTAKDFVFGMFTGSSLTAGDVGAGYTNLALLNGAFVETQWEYQTQPSAGAIAVTASLISNQSWIALGAAFLSAPDVPALTGNAIRITNLTASALTNQPFSIMRVFSQGEITAYARPTVGGTPSTFWQCDKKTSWADGSLQSAIISFRGTVPANGMLVVSFANNANPSSAGNPTATAAAALTKAQILAYDTGGGSGSWNAIAALTNGTTKTVDAKTILTAWNGTDTGINGLGVRYWLKGPVATQVIVEDRTSARAYDTGFATGNPIHPIFPLTFYPGDGGSISNWAGVKTEFDLENVWTGNEAGTGMQMVDDQYSVVLQTGASPTTVYSQATFKHYARTRWRQKCWSGTSAERTSSGGTIAGTPIYVVDFNFAYLTASKVLWNWDTSLVVPAYVFDPTGISTYNGDGGFSEVALAATYNDQGTNPNDIGELMPHTGAGGGRGDDKKLVSRWDVYYLYSMNNPAFHAWRMFDVMQGNGEVGAHFPMHFRENLTGRKYCQYSATCVSQGLDTMDAYGHWFSIDSRVGARLYPGLELGGTFGVTTDNVAIGTAPTYRVASCHVGCGGPNWGGGPGNGTSDWGYQVAHQYEFSLIAYLTSGDYYQLEELQLWGSVPIAQFGEDAGAHSRGQNHFGYVNGENDYRNQAWGMRAMVDAWFFSPDGTPEKAYFKQKLDNNIAVKEGRFNLTTVNGGLFYTGTTNNNDPWYWGHTVADYQGANPANLGLNALGYDGAVEGGSPFDPHIPGTNYCCSTAGAVGTQETFETYFIRIMYGFAYDRGITEVLPVFRASSKFFLHQVLDSLANPWLTAAEFYPSLDAGFNPDLVFFQSWSTYFNAFSAEMKAVPNNGSNGWTYMAGATPPLISSNSQNLLELDYPRLMRAGTSWMKDLGFSTIDSTNGTTLTGAAAWSWFQNNGNDVARDYLMPNYAIIPRGGSTPPVTGTGVFPLPSAFRH